MKIYVKQHDYTVITFEKEIRKVGVPSKSHGVLWEIDKSIHSLKEMDLQSYESKPKYNETINDCLLPVLVQL